MTLPYVPENNKRMYQCFVCGIEFSNYEDYKTHIIDNHEEGRDYVKCPLARCGAPVRDVRMHFKSRHPHDTMPKCCQMSAIVWRDIRPTNKKQKKPKYKQGFYPSTKTGKQFKFLSSWEEDVYRCLDMWEDVLTFEAEPFKIPYLFEGTAHNYKPDILVAFIDGHKELWEIKPARQTDLPVNKAKWYAAEQACKARGWGWKVITERSVNQLKKKVRIQGLEDDE